MIHLDTSFLVDLLRETARGRPGPATARLDAWGSEELWLSVHALCELEAGAAMSRDPEGEGARVRELVAELQVAYPDNRFAARYAELFATLERSGQRIGQMDLLIATCAVVAGAPIATRNKGEFARVPGLRVIGY